MGEEPMTDDEARRFEQFMLGKGKFAGAWFFDVPPGERGAFWWRKHFSAYVARAAAAERHADNCTHWRVCWART